MSVTAAGNHGSEYPVKNHEGVGGLNLGKKSVTHVAMNQEDELKKGNVFSYAQNHPELA